MASATRLLAVAAARLNISEMTQQEQRRRTVQPNKVQQYPKRHAQVSWVHLPFRLSKVLLLARRSAAEEFSHQGRLHCLTAKSSVLPDENIKFIARKRPFTV